MRRINNRATRLAVAALLINTTWLMPGCATLAHRNAQSHSGNANARTCASDGAVCPWIVGDALLLIPGIVPGVIAFIVDFSTGEWQHGGSARTADTSGDAPAVRTVAATD